MPLDTHSSTAHIDHSRSSNLSDILEEEEYEEEDDSSVVPSAQKWAQTSRNPVTDSSGKVGKAVFVELCTYSSRNTFQLKFQRL